MNAPIIDRFYVKGEGHIPLSNFYVGEPIIIPAYGCEELVADIPVFWQTSEHYYQAAKFFGADDIMYVHSASSPGESKRRVREHLPTFRKDWDALMLDAMRTILAAKFAPDRAEAEFLMGTGTALLIEGNDWGDRFWGAERDKLGNYTRGKNWLGWLLMAQRSYLRSLLVFPSQARLEFE